MKRDRAAAPRTRRAGPHPARCRESARSHSGEGAGTVPRGRRCHSSDEENSMTVTLKPLAEQVIVLTGASSGIGLATARAAAERGAKLVLVARNEAALQEIAGEIRSRGGDAVAVAADVSQPEDLRRVAETAIERFGGFDTWINDAAVAIYGTIEEVPLADQRKLFEINYWGVVEGSLIAAKHLKRRGGAIINVGS